MNDETKVRAIIRKWKIEYLYHFTPRKNLASIREHGICPNSSLNEMGIFQAEFASNEWSQTEDNRRGLHKYVHLCFNNQHPMEYRKRIQEGMDMVFLQIDSSVLLYPEVSFTNDVSNKSGIRTFEIDNFEKNIDCEVLFMKTDWHDPDIQERLQNARKSEILIPQIIPSSKIIFPL